MAVASFACTSGSLPVLLAADGRAAVEARRKSAGTKSKGLGNVMGIRDGQAMPRTLHGFAGVWVVSDQRHGCALGARKVAKPREFKPRACSFAGKPSCRNGCVALRRAARASCPLLRRRLPPPPISVLFPRAGWTLHQHLASSYHNHIGHRCRVKSLDFGKCH